MCRTTLNKVPSKVKPYQSNQTEGSSPRIIIIIHGVRVSRLRFVSSVLKDEGVEQEIHVEVNKVSFVAI